MYGTEQRADASAANGSDNRHAKPKVFIIVIPPTLNQNIPQLFVESIRGRHASEPRGNADRQPPFNAPLTRRLAPQAG
jgi:hypothetical protein